MGKSSGSRVSLSNIKGIGPPARRGCARRARRPLVAKPNPHGKRRLSATFDFPRRRLRGPLHKFYMKNLSAWEIYACQTAA
jgi:hypothetical protein